MVNDSIIELRLDEESEKFMAEHENAMRSSPFIFKVPESVSRDNPDAFLPCLIALGPQNASNKKMNSYKVDIAKKVGKELHLPEFHQLRTQLQRLQLKIQACYDTRFEIDSENSARIMLMDALFLLGLLLNISAQMQNSVSIELPLPNFDDQIHSSNIDHKMLLNDVVKLQNQIPLLIFQRILPQPLMVKFPVLLYHFSQSLSPFALGIFRKRNVSVTKIDPYEISDICGIVEESHHLLHFMYLSILISSGIYRIDYIQESAAPKDYDDPLTHTFFKKWFSRVESFLDFIQNAMKLMGLIQTLLKLMGMFKNQNLAHKTTSSNVIPSASQLHKLPVNFQPIDDGILGVRFTSAIGHFALRLGRFDPGELTENRMQSEFILPVMNINAFTETLLENLLAFEAMANINPPVYSLYIDLMKSLIRNPKDVQILKKKRIITSHLDSDEEVVKLFKRLGSSISNLKNPMIRNLEPMTFSFERINKYEEVYKEMVEEINLYYDSFWRVKATRYMKKVVSFVWKMLGILFIFFQILVVANKLISSIIGNDEH